MKKRYKKPEPLNTTKIGANKIDVDDKSCKISISKGPNQTARNAMSPESDRKNNTGNSDARTDVSTGESACVTSMDSSPSLTSPMTTSSTGNSNTNSNNDSGGDAVVDVPLHLTDGSTDRTDTTGNTAIKTDMYDDHSHVDVRITHNDESDCSLHDEKERREEIEEEGEEEGEGEGEGENRTEGGEGEEEEKLFALDDQRHKLSALGSGSVDIGGWGDVHLVTDHVNVDANTVFTANPMGENTKHSYQSQDQKDDERNENEDGYKDNKPFFMDNPLAEIKAKKGKKTNKKKSEKSNGSEIKTEGNSVQEIQSPIIANKQ